jgi:glycosyltransferase involved in cell wall biosynthesis
VIIQAMARLPQLPLYYILCGKGKEAEFLQELAQSLHLSNRVRILGYRQDVCDLLHASDIFCFPSKREGLGMAALEAMEAGLPLVTSNIHGIRDYSLSGETGFACPVSNVEEFAHAIETLSENRNLRKRMGAYNQQAVEAFYQAKTDEIMKSVYTDVLKLDEILPETEPEPVESASSSRT